MEGLADANADLVTVQVARRLGVPAPLLHRVPDYLVTAAQLEAELEKQMRRKQERKA